MGNGAVTFGYNLMWTPDFAVQKAHCPAGEVFPSHIHDVNEWLIIYKGRVVVHIGDEEIECGVGEHVFIPAGTEHYVRILETTAMIGVTVPAEESYPR